MVQMQLSLPIKSSYVTISTISTPNLPYKECVPSAEIHSVINLRLLSMKKEIWNEITRMDGLVQTREHFLIGI